MQKIFLSVIIPCYNEEKNLQRKVLDEVYKYLSKKDFNFEVIISDDGSTDNSKEIIEKQIKTLKNFKLLKNEHGGKPSALLSGLKQAKGEWVLFTDMDQSTPIDQLDKLLPFTKYAEVVIGSRGFNRNNFSILRRIGSVVFLTFRRILILPEIKDTQCGFKLFKRTDIEKAFPELEFFKTKQRTSGWKVTSYDVELLHILKINGCKIKEVEVSWHDRDVSNTKGHGSGRYFRESEEMLMQIIRVKMNDMKGLYS
ncbi:MAG TPA: glycosyltransferase [Patescibacteria group bacterium]|nr:glycosyltransferase [Patescibacteria group bacterium]